MFVPLLIPIIMKKLSFLIVCVALSSFVVAQSIQMQSLSLSPQRKGQQTHIAISTNPINIAKYNSIPIALDIKPAGSDFSHNIRFAKLNGMESKDFFGNMSSSSKDADPNYVISGTEFSYTAKFDAVSGWYSCTKRERSFHQYVGLRIDWDKYQNASETFRIMTPNGEQNYSQAINVTRRGAGLVTGIQIFNLFKFIYVDVYGGVGMGGRNNDLPANYRILNDNRFNEARFGGFQYWFNGGWRIGITLF